MELVLSWDLFVIVFFALVITYSFIVGKHDAVKVIVASYISIIAGQAIGNIFLRFGAGSNTWFDLIGVSLNVSLLGTTKLLIFIIVLILLSIRGGLDIDYDRDGSLLGDIILIAAFGFSTAAMLLSTLITFVSESSLLDPIVLEQTMLSPIVQESLLLQYIILYQDIWFALPALLLIGLGIASKEGKDD